MKRNQTHKEPPFNGSFSPTEESQQALSPTSGIYGLTRPPAAAPCGPDNPSRLRWPLNLSEEEFAAMVERLNLNAQAIAEILR